MKSQKSEFKIDTLCFHFFLYLVHYYLLSNKRRRTNKRAAATKVSSRIAKSNRVLFFLLKKVNSLSLCRLSLATLAYLDEMPKEESL